MSLRGHTLVAATLVLAGLGAGPAVAQQRPSTVPSTRQQVFAQAAKAYHVPEKLLLAVSYMESRWDANKGLPSTSGGFGPMHLVDGMLVPGSEHLASGSEDARGDTARPALKASAAPARTAAPAQAPPQTLQEAARLTGTAPATLRSDPAANIRGGAAVLAGYQRALHEPLSPDPAAWYAAVVKYGGTKWFAGQVYDLIRDGASRITDDGQQVTLTATPGLRVPAEATSAPQTECPKDLGCEWVPAPYQQLDPNDPANYGNHDLGDRPKSQKIDYIVVHDTEGSYDTALDLVQDPTYLGWNYTIRSSDGHVAQHLLAKDVGWHAGNWYINAKSIGIEHEGYLAQGGAWYTEAMYRSSAELVRYLARRFHIPLDRGHILGHDNVPAIAPAYVQGMHQDPGPYWDWAHYFDLLHAPLHPTAPPHSTEVMIRPDYDTNVVGYTDCDTQNPAALCPPHGGGSIMLHTAPSDDAPLVKDIGLHPPSGTSTMAVWDHGARAATGQKYAVAGRQGDWTAIWYLGQKAWFHDRDPAGHPVAVGVHGLVATPKPGAASVPVYGRAYPEASAYPAGVPVQSLIPMQYTFAAGQSYAVVGAERGEYYYSTTFDTASHVVVKGALKYYEIQFGHRVYFVKADDVVLRPAG